MSPTLTSSSPAPTTLSVGLVLCVGVSIAAVTAYSLLPDPTQISDLVAQAVLVCTVVGGMSVATMVAWRRSEGSALALAVCGTGAVEGSAGMVCIDEGEHAPSVLEYETRPMLLSSDGRAVGAGS